MGLFSGVSKTFQKIGKQAKQNTINAVVAPIKYASELGVRQIAAAKPGLAAATDLLQSNPALAGLAGNALGMPGLGGLFGGAPAPVEPMSGAFSAPPPAAGVPVWVWIAAAGAAVLGLVLFLRRKS